jgi:hypothetical protein
MAERWLAATFNRPGHEIVDHHTYVLASDGDMMEGISSEVASLAGTLRLGRLVVVYDANQVTLSGTTDLTFTEDVGARFDACGWHVQRIDGMNVESVDAALRAARADDRPSLIVARTHIGYGSPKKQDTFGAHGEPLGTDEVRATKRALGWPRSPRSTCRTKRWPCSGPRWPEARSWRPRGGAVWMRIAKPTPRPETPSRGPWLASCPRGGRNACPRSRRATATWPLATLAARSSARWLAS